MSKLYTMAVITSHPRLGTKLRFGNQDRTAILVKEGHDPIRYCKLTEEPQEKAVLAAQLAQHPDFQDELAQQTIMEFLGKKSKPVEAVVTQPAEEPVAEVVEEVTDVVVEESTADRKAKGKAKRQAEPA